MDKHTANQIMCAAEQPIHNSGMKAALAADAIHANPRCILPIESAAALVAWQAKQFNGEWDLVMLAEVMHFIRLANIFIPPTRFAALEVRH